jgi:hypothetical protein
MHRRLLVPKIVTSSGYLPFHAHNQYYDKKENPFFSGMKTNKSEEKS